MSVAESNPDGPGSSPRVAPAVDGSPRKRHWWAWLLGAGVVALSILGVLLGKAAVYQPISWGGLQAQFPGMPTGVGIKGVNNFGLLGGDYYVPPQRGVFSFGALIVNNGSRPVIIEAVTPSESPADDYAIWAAGPVLYTTDMGTPGKPRTHILRNVTVGPGLGIFIGIPLRTQPCGSTDGWVTDPAFYVKERFLFFTHTVALPWSMHGARLIMHNPGGKPGAPGTICAPQ
jgi:hypothetical protein